MALAIFLVVALLSSIVSGRGRELAEEAAIRRVAVDVAQARSATEIFETAPVRSASSRAPNSRGWSAT